MVLDSTSCPAENTVDVQQGSFWDPGNTTWDAHRIGWAIAGSCTIATILITLVSVFQHCRHYTVPSQQRQILRILYMPPIYAIVSFFSYRYFRAYTYYSLIEVAYEAITLSAFLLLLIEYVADTTHGHDAGSAMARKDKRPLPLPFCFWRYRPTKAYFMYTLKWSVLQYCIVRPAISIAGIICEAYGVLCPSGPYSIHFAEVYLDSIDFVSISVALYGLIVFYVLTREELQGRRPLAKFLCIKLIVIATFYQGFVFDALENRVIKGTKYWTATNIADGLNALTTCIEMVIFSALMLWAYPAAEYKTKGSTWNIFRPLWDSINYSDFVMEIWTSLKFFIDYVRGKPDTRGEQLHSADVDDGVTTFGKAFRIEGEYFQPADSEFDAAGPGNAKKHDHSIRLAPYRNPTVNGSTDYLRRTPTAGA